MTGLISISAEEATDRFEAAFAPVKADAVTVDGDLVHVSVTMMGYPVTMTWPKREFDRVCPRV